ncbi:hypothetical protein [Paraflavitalea sp. CAU 1676]|uniref:hypothetical protein n=1 Tax=Paraflavitalea sp. CAU 1676 TaxID=3032598 RepID=UPI0023DC97C2|nr:hypothetical protein [Paraflavitalea sp. CAU 1676]MDF2190826.1 hypothetical protein [Paraflavitalea sp. CAU 1676]
MESCLQQKEPHQLILRLTNAQQQDPRSVVDNFFECYHLQDLRTLLWQWLTAGLSSDNGYPKGADRSNLIFLYENMEAFAEAVYLIQSDKNARRHRKKKKKVKNN